MSYIKNILEFKDRLRNLYDYQGVTNKTFKEFLEVLWPCLNNLEYAIMKEEKKTPQEIEQELPLGKQFPHRLGDFRDSHPFCRKLSFGQTRLSGMIKKNNNYFMGTFYQHKPVGKGKGFYWIDEQKFLQKLLNYPYKSPAEKMLVEEYKKETGFYGTGE